ncbi:SusC/RagA family TonB-linked outer membrane protein [Winogradskyella eximia]|uniref:SusC/RagA family TonB-linked outer membrane protein n=1 Tax=Winogradskyella eximia TaxID=262006 RepID=UPI00248FC741|nr:TonB-dependent receptor [Winogradskyella eximia]
MNLKVKLITIVALFFSVMIFAQDGYTIKGTVTSAADNMPIPGANIIVVGTTKGSSTDFDGNYQLEVKKGDVVQFSYVGYVTQSITIDSQTTLSVQLVEDTNALEEVVVVGYGTRKKSHSTGSIAQVKGKDVAAVQAARVDEALAGKLSGVLIQNQSGEPGADPKIQIRAASSVSGDSGPLIVVDGYPISGNLATVNPNDIESLEVLKDAASAAIYGSRGANGVILVTTKKGKEGKASFSYNSYYSTSSKYRSNILPTSREWDNTIETNVNNGNWDLSGLDQDVLALRRSLYRNSPDVVSVEDWLFQNGSSSSHDFSVSGGTDDVNYFASLGYQNTEGVVLTQGFERLNARLNIDAKLGKKFKTGLSFNGFTSKRDILAHDMRDLLRAYSIHPIFHTAESIAYVQQLDAQAQAIGLSAFDNGFSAGNANSESPMNSSIYTLQPGDYAHDWHYGRNGLFGGSSNQGPAAKLLERKQYENNYFANVNGYLQYSIIDGLDLKTVLGGDMRDTKQYYHQLSQADRRGEISRTRLNETNTKRTSVLSETTLAYNKVIGKHDISAVVGVEFQSFYTEAISVNGINLPNDDILNYNLLQQADITVTERDETIARNGIFGRIQYAYDDRYLASVSLRRDGDSRFGKNKRHATFPALSLGWNVHNEKFWTSETISLLKLRFSTGSLGTTAFLGAYNSLSLLNPSPSAFGTAYLIPEDVENSDLTWQTNTETNYGINLGFLNNRFRIGVDYYTSDIEDMLLSQSVSEVLGTAAIKKNIGDLRSSGFELELSAGIIQNEDFSWNINANLSTVTTEIMDLGQESELPREQFGTSGRGPFFRNYVGGEIGEMWGYETSGEVPTGELVDPTLSPGNSSGYSYIVDQNGDDVINEEDLVKIGQNTPDFYWGMSHSISYKNFDMGIQFQGAQGGEVYNLDPLYYGSEWGRSLRSDFDSNTSDDVDNSGRTYGRNRDQTDHGIQDASYIALRNLTIGYTLNSDLVSKIGLSSVRAYLAATNLLYIMGDDYTSYNPEGVTTSDGGGDTYKGPTTYGVQNGASPLVRSFTLGLNVNF